MPNPAWIHDYIPSFWKQTKERIVWVEVELAAPWRFWKIPQWRRSRKYWITIRGNVIISHSRSIMWHVYVGLGGGVVYARARRYSLALTIENVHLVQLTE